MEKKKNNFSLAITGIKDSCTGCGACVNVCPVNAIVMDYDEEGFYYPVVDTDLCIGCMKCERHCHVLNFTKAEEPVSYTAYMCWAKDDELRYKSSSGGAFSLLADAILAKGGVVFGARYNYEKERLEHNHTDNFDLSEFRKSKYIESDTRNTFSEVKHFLDAGRFVLYCGTPCQIVGLKSFLDGTDTLKLLLIDFVCHGVPSNKHFTEYKNFVTKNNKLAQLDFRPKKTGWTPTSVILHTERNEICIPVGISIFYRAFYDNLMLRRSCYKCSFVNRHKSDITIADFWGVRKYKPAADDDKGISLVVVNSNKGAESFKAIGSNMVQEGLPLSAIKYAYRIRDDAHFDINRRELVAQKILSNGYVNTMKGFYRKDIFMIKLKTSVKRLAKKILGKK